MVRKSRRAVSGASTRIKVLTWDGPCPWGWGGPRGHAPRRHSWGPSSVTSAGVGRVELLLEIVELLSVVGVIGGWSGTH